MLSPSLTTFLPITENQSGLGRILCQEPLREQHEASHFMIYADAVYEWMRGAEQRCLPNIEAIGLQQDVNSKMRQILVDWLIDVHAKFRMRGETLFTCVNIVDRMLSLHQIDRKQL